MEPIILLTTALFLCLLWVCYRHLSNPHDYWEKQGVPSIPAVSIAGSMLPIFRKGRHEFQLEAYKKYGRLYGHYVSTKPVLNVGDPDLLRLILSKDFHIFHDRTNTHSGNPIADRMLPQLRGDDWKRVRSLLTPVFTTGKLKKMLAIMADSAKTLVLNLDDVARSKKPADMKKYFGAYSMDVIASCVFATKFDSFNDPENIFVTVAKRAINPEVPWRLITLLVFPALRKLFRISVWNPKDLMFFRDVTLRIIEQRKKTGQKRDDFLQLLIDIADETSQPADEKDERNELSQGDIDDLQHSFIRGKELTMDELVASCVIFFLAGYDTSSSTLSFIAYSLSLNPDVQEKLVAEVDETMKKYNGEITYDSLQGLKYMDMVINETLRMYSIALTLCREAAEDYKLGDTGITIPKGMIVTIPVYSIHHDPDFYPDPEKFDPERFSAEEKARRNPYIFLPFGAGPRNCIGMRFALMEIKIALSLILSRFTFKKCSQTKVPMQYQVAQQLLTPKDITVTVEERVKM